MLFVFFVHLLGTRGLEFRINSMNRAKTNWEGGGCIKDTISWLSNIKYTYIYFRLVYKDSNLFNILKLFLHTFFRRCRKTHFFMPKNYLCEQIKMTLFERFFCESALYHFLYREGGNEFCQKNLLFASQSRVKLQLPELQSSKTVSGNKK